MVNHACLWPLRRLTQKVTADKVVRLRFQDVGKLPPPVLQFTQVTFGYSPDKVLYRDVDLGVDLVSPTPASQLVSVKPSSCQVATR